MTARARRSFWPALAAVLVFTVAAGAGFVTAPDQPAPRTTTASDSSSGTRGTVQALDGNILRLTVDGAVREFTLSGDAEIEVLRPAAQSAITTNDWLNIGSTPNTENLFTIVGITIIAESLVADR